MCVCVCVCVCVSVCVYVVCLCVVGVCVFKDKKFLVINFAAASIQLAKHDFSDAKINDRLTISITIPFGKFKSLVHKWNTAAANIIRSISGSTAAIEVVESVVRHGEAFLAFLFLFSLLLRRSWRVKD